jgi:hypothetical protein
LYKEEEDVNFDEDSDVVTDPCHPLNSNMPHVFIEGDAHFNSWFEGYSVVLPKNEEQPAKQLK